MLGTLLDGKYRLTCKLGAGGMAVVYEAVDVDLDRPVAVKMLNLQLSSQDEFVARFRHEARTAAKIPHPNLVTIHGTSPEAATIPYIVMELLRGRDLQQELNSVGRMEWTQAARIAIQICDALAEAHGAGIVHRDVKPANCFLVSAPTGRIAEHALGQVKLLDLGIAKLVGPQDSLGTTLPRTEQGRVLGTWQYMAPEQLDNKACTQTDIYAVGALLYRMITGRHALEREGLNNHQYAARIARDYPRLPSELVPEIPSDLEELIMAMLSKAPDDRPRTVQVVRGALLGELNAERRRCELGKAVPSLRILYRSASALMVVALLAMIGVVVSSLGSSPALAQPSRESVLSGVTRDGGEASADETSGAGRPGAGGERVHRREAREDASKDASKPGEHLGADATASVASTTGMGGAEDTADTSIREDGAGDGASVSNTAESPVSEVPSNRSRVVAALRMRKPAMRMCMAGDISNRKLTKANVHVTVTPKGAKSVTSVRVSQIWLDGKLADPFRQKDKIGCTTDALKGLSIKGLDLAGEATFTIPVRL